MPFKSGARQSGQSGTSNQSNSQRVSEAGRHNIGKAMRSQSLFRSGPRGQTQSIAVLGTPTTADLLTTTVTINCPTNLIVQPLAGTMYMIVDENTMAPSVAQIKAGLEQAGGAADFDDSQVVSVSPVSFDVTGLTLDTQYDAWFVQETEDGDSNIANVQFTTAAA